MQERNGKHSALGSGGEPSLHSAWQQFIRYCTELGHGEIEKLKIQDGLPMAAEVTTKKVRFGP